MTNPLFDKSPNWPLNACLNYGLDNWHVYAIGYRRAAEIITEHVRKTHSDQDGLIFPVLFLWRHHIELQLKGIARDAAHLLDKDWSPQRQHSLTQLLGMARTLIVESCQEFNERAPRGELDRLKAAIRALDDIDAESMSFRYPEDLSGDKHLESVQHINFEVVERYMSAVSDSLDGITSTLSIFGDWQNEARSAY